MNEQMKIAARCAEACACGTSPEAAGNRAASTCLCGDQCPCGADCSCGE